MKKTVLLSNITDRQAVELLQMAYPAISRQEHVRTVFKRNQTVLYAQTDFLFVLEPVPSLPCWIWRIKIEVLY